MQLLRFVCTLLLLCHTQPLAIHVLDAIRNRVTPQKPVSNTRGSFTPFKLQDLRNSLRTAVSHLRKGNGSAAPGVSEVTGTVATLKKPVILARVVSWLLMKLVESRTQQADGLEISVHSDSNHHVITGKLGTIEMKFDKLEYAQLFVSGGGKVVIEGLQLRIRRFLFQKLQSVRQPYRIHCDLHLTQQDIMKSVFIRNLIQRVADAVMEKVLNTKKVLNLSVTGVTIQRGRIHVAGTATFLTDSPITVLMSSYSKAQNTGGLISADFEITTKISARTAVPQIVSLEDVLVVVNPDSTLLRTILPIPGGSINIDLGEHCNLQTLTVDDHSIHLCGSSLISPVKPLTAVSQRYRKVPVLPKIGSSIASFRYDLASVLSSVLKLNGGIITSRFGWS